MGLASNAVQAYAFAPTFKERHPLGNHKWGQQVQDAVARRDVSTLRRMATTAERKEISMWLTLLARMLEVDAAARRRHGARPGRLATLPPTRRIGALRRAV